jgi:nitrate reductase gamma subunit
MNHFNIEEFIMWLQILTYLSLFIFFVVFAYKIFKIASAPVHFRWELYPVPHEKGKAEHGGSRLEDVDWWTKKQEKDRFNEYKEMFMEIFFLKNVKEHNEELWSGSYPFHLGMYFIITDVVLTLIATILNINGISVNSAAAGIGQYIYWLIIIVALCCGVFGFFGSVRMFFFRVVDKNLSLYATPSHYYNIIFIGLIFLTGILWLLMDRDFLPQQISYYTSIMTFSTFPVLPFIGKLHILLFLLFLIYMPFTHMTHMVNKYFMYHSVRWEDAPNLNGGKMQEKISKLLNQTVTWSAPHIGADGMKNWIAIASSMPGKEKK